MNEQTLSLIQQLAEKLGTTTEYLFSILVIQAKVKIFQNVFSIILFLISAYLMYRAKEIWCKKIEEQKKEFFDCSNSWILVVWAIVNFIWFFETMGDIIEIITCIANPEYWAIQQILKQINQ